MSTTINIPTDVSERIENAEVNFGHFPVLDGLRGIAVITVMCYHLEFLVPSLHTVVKGGFLGVDMFFVLSGFLITSILVKEHDQNGKISLKNFYIRRTLRLMPAFWVFLITLFFLGKYILPANEAAVIYDNNNFVYAAVYLMNWHHAAGGVLTGNLNHTWSLAIEEQFYIIWSLVLVKAFAEARSRKQIAAGTAFFIILLITQRAIRAALGASIDVLYYSTDTRIDALLIGCLASMLYCWKLIPSRIFSSDAFARVSYMAVIVAFAIFIGFFHEDLSLYYGSLSMFSAAVAVMILWLITHKNTVVHKFLEFKPLRWLGLISYGLYLWHYVFYEFAKSRFENVPVQIFVALSLAFVVSSLSFYLIEKPILKIKKRFAKNDRQPRTVFPTVEMSDVLY